LGDVLEHRLIQREIGDNLLEPLSASCWTRCNSATTIPANRFFQGCDVVSCSTRSKDLVEHAERLFGGRAPRIALRVFIGLGNQGLSVLHVL